MASFNFIFDKKKFKFISKSSEKLTGSVKTLKKHLKKIKFLNKFLLNKTTKYTYIKSYSKSRKLFVLRLKKKLNHLLFNKNIKYPE